MKNTILLFCGAVIISFAGAKSCWGDDRIKIDNTSPAAMYNSWARNRNFINEQAARRNNYTPVIHPLAQTVHVRKTNTSGTPPKYRPETQYNAFTAPLSTR